MRERDELESAFADHGSASSRLITEIDPADGMLPHHGSRQYFQVGASALAAIKAVLAAAGKSCHEIRSILDYACGYGRVLRWLRAEFHEADVLAMDIDEKALASVRRILDVDTRLIQPESLSHIGRSFDLIWVGSLFTHLPEERSRRLLDHLSLHLSATGLLVFTTHGPYVAERIRSGEKQYGLEPEQRFLLLSGYDSAGFGFGSYSHISDYGISVATQTCYENMIAEKPMTVVFYEERMWANHQDVYAAHLQDSPGNDLSS